LFSFRGRINRARYWLWTIGIIALFVIIALATFAAPFLFAMVGLPVAQHPATWLATWLVYMAAPFLWLWITLALVVKRLHDRDKSGGWLFLFYLLPQVPAPFIPYASGTTLMLLVLIELVAIWGFVEIG
jgi:uncharacterized membrane protein YhaH (DUF805 family)